MGCGASTKNRSPYLNQYYEEVIRVNERDTKRGRDDPLWMFGLLTSKEKKAEHEASTKKEYETVLPPLIEKSFEHHDKNKDGILDTKESAVFFQNLVCENTRMLEAMFAYPCRLTLAADLKEHADYIGDNEQIKADWERETGFKVEWFKEKMQSILAEKEEGIAKFMQELKEEYVASKAERDAAAFKALDVNNDGQLQKTELVAALIPSTPQYLKLTGTLLGMDEDSYMDEKSYTKHLNGRLHRSMYYPKQDAPREPKPEGPSTLS